MRVVGIDPGLTGALALWDNGKVTRIFDMPVVAGEVNAFALWATLGSLHAASALDAVVLEETHAMPKTGSQANYSQGFSKGAIVAVVTILHLPLHRVAPATWKRGAGLTGKDKAYALRLARELWPDLAERLNLVKHHNRAEAALIARYWVMRQVVAA